MRFDCAQTEITFLRKRLTQLEERLSSELSSKKELEQKVSQDLPWHWEACGAAGGPRAAGLGLRASFLTSCLQWEPFHEPG